jgi:thiol-disulfide isomerase/thioredoxin
MRRTLCVVLYLVTVEIAAAQMPPRGFTDAAALLDAVAKTYAVDTAKFHLESITETVKNEELERSWSKSVLTAVKGEGKRFRIEARTPTSTWVQDSDGGTEWVYVREGHVYVKRPVADAPQFPRMYTSGTIELKNAWEMRAFLEADAERAKSATMLADETIAIAGHGYPCYVVHATSDGAGWHADSTFWIEKQALVFRKILEHRDGELIIVPGLPSLKVPFHEDVTTVYPVVDLNAQDAPELFAFVPPADAKEVSTLEPQMPGFKSAAPQGVGRLVPDISLTGTDGKLVKLSSFRGQPLLIDVWATWCAPCLAWMPSLGKLEQEMRTKGLQVISVDRDKEAVNATHYLAVHGFSWPNYHDGDGKLAVALSEKRIPLTVLIDTQGRIAFMSVDSDEAALRKAIAGLESDKSGSSR